MDQQNNPLIGLGGMNNPSATTAPETETLHSHSYKTPFLIAGAILLIALLVGGYRYYSDYRFNQYVKSFESDSQTLYAKEIEYLKLENVFSEHIQTGISQSRLPESTIQGIKNEFDSASQNYNSYLKSQSADVQPLVQNLSQKANEINKEKLWLSSGKKEHLKKMQTALEQYQTTWKNSVEFQKQNEPVMQDLLNMLQGTAEAIKMGTYASTEGGNAMISHISEIGNLKQYSDPSYAFVSGNKSERDYPEFYKFLNNSKTALGHFYTAMAAAQAGDVETFNFNISKLVTLEDGIEQAGNPISSIVKKEGEVSDKPMIAALTSIAEQVEKYNSSNLQKGFFQTGQALGKNRYIADILGYQISLYQGIKSEFPKSNSITDLLSTLSKEGYTTSVPFNTADFTYTSSDGEGYSLSYHDEILNKTITIERK
jgi:hypothetical protein